jgi:hypothetical protein
MHRSSATSKSTVQSLIKKKTPEAEIGGLGIFLVSERLESDVAESLVGFCHSVHIFLLLES